MQSLKFKTLHRLQTRTHARTQTQGAVLFKYPNTHTHTCTCVRTFANKAYLYVSMYVFCFAFGAALSPHSTLAFPTPLSHFPTLALFLSSLPSRRRRAVVFQTYCAARIFSTM